MKQIEFYLQKILCLLTLITSTTAETFMISRTRTGEIYRTDLTKYAQNQIARSNNVGTSNFINREQWLLQPPKNTPPPLRTPVHYIMVMKASSELCTTESECTRRVRIIQGWDVENLLIYNFLIGGDGNVYEGRGWQYEGEHPKGGFATDDSISVAYIGIDRGEPTKLQVNAAELLLSQGVRTGKIAADYKAIPIHNLERVPAMRLISNADCENVNGEQATRGRCDFANSQILEP